MEWDSIFKWSTPTDKERLRTSTVLHLYVLVVISTVKHLMSRPPTRLEPSWPTHLVHNEPYMLWGACFWSYDCDIRPVTCEVLMCQSRWHNIDRTEQTCHTTKFSSLPFVKNCWKMTEHSANLLSRQNLDIPKHHWMTFHSLWTSSKLSHLHFQPQNSLLESRLILTTLGLKSLPSCFVLFFWDILRDLETVCLCRNLCSILRFAS